MHKMTSRFLDWWFRPHHPFALRIFEVLICFSMTIYFTSYLGGLDIWISDTGFHLSASATSSNYLKPPPLVPQDWLNVVVVGFYSLMTLYMLGYARRFIAFVFFLGAVYVQAVDQPSAFTVNRMFIVSFLVLSLQPPEYEEDGRRYISGWVVRFFQLTLLVQYSTSGVCKANPGDWIIWEPFGFHWNIVWTQSQGHYKNILTAYALNYLPWFVWYTLSLFSYLFELMAPLWFGWKKSRYWAVGFGIFFHLGIAVLMKDLIYFSFQMITSYILFIHVIPLLKAERWLLSKLGRQPSEQHQLELRLHEDQHEELLQSETADSKEA